MAGNLVICQALATVTDQSVRCEARAVFQDYAGGHKLSPLGVGYSEDSYLVDRRMGEDDSLDLAAIHIFTACDDHVLQPVQDVEIAVCVLVADVWAF